MPAARQRLPLTALRTFEVAARLLSFKAAADELRVSPTTVSNQIRQLERDWSCTLFIRKTRHIVLTETGRSLARICSRAFDDLRAGIEAHVGGERKTVSVAAGPIFAARWLIPRLSRFYRRHPGLALELRHGGRAASADQLGADIGIDWGAGGWVDLEATHLLAIVYRPVLSPACLAAHGGIAAPADLARFPILHQHDRSEWRAWLRLAGVPGLELAEETLISDANVTIQAALDGQGVALGTFPFLDGEVAAGRLVCPFEIDLHPDRAYHLVTRPGARATPEVAAACDWLLAEARGTG